MTEESNRLATGEPELLVDIACQTGEGPLWHEETRRLYWVDIPAGRLYRFDTETNENELVYEHDGMIGGFTIQADGSLVLFGDNGKIVHLLGDQPETIMPEVEAMRGSRFNDVIADPEGRIYCGTMPLNDNTAHLYRLDADGSLTLVVDDLTQANGMGFSPDLQTFYLTDSNSRRIFRATYDRASGDLRDRETLVTTPDDGSVPDGIAVDAEGNIWSARHGASGIFRYGPDGRPLGMVEIPVRKVTSLTFGGPEYDTAYVTTAGGNERSAEAGTLAGSLFRIDPKTRGRAPFRSRIGM